LKAARFFQRLPAGGVNFWDFQTTNIFITILNPKVMHEFGVFLGFYSQILYLQPWLGCMHTSICHWNGPAIGFGNAATGSFWDVRQKKEE